MSEVRAALTTNRGPCPSGGRGKMTGDPWTDSDPQPGDFDAELDEAGPDQIEVHEGHERSIHADAGRKGKAVEHLIAALCVLGSNGELNAWTSLVDDEGVDLVLQRRNRPETISLQVKSRLTSGKGITDRKRFQSQVRAATFRPRDDLYMLFVVADPTTLDLKPLWLVPSRDFIEKAPVGSSGKHRFVASIKPDTKDRWADYLVKKERLASRLLAAF
ncbi:MAG: hypothetical protein ACTHK6_06040 [Solirubrobacterales bacterium]